MLVDSHCHLNFPKLVDEIGTEQAISEARAAGVGGMLTICCELAKEPDQLKEIAHSYENIWYTIGTHPHDSGVEAEKAFTQSQIVEMAKADDKVVGIGESGLDYFHMNSSKEDQQESFRKHIRACIEADLPLIVHSRDAEEDTMRIIREEGEGTKLKGLMHCFSSKRVLAEEAVEFGFYISFSGILTFNKSEELREIAKDVPKDKLLIETDAPFLAPSPNRGKVNQPAYIIHTNQCLADLHGVSAKDMGTITTENFFRLFDRATLVA